MTQTDADLERAYRAEPALQVIRDMLALQLELIPAGDELCRDCWGQLLVDLARPYVGPGRVDRGASRDVAGDPTTAEPDAAHTLDWLSTGRALELVVGRWLAMVDRRAGARRHGSARSVSHR